MRCKKLCWNLEGKGMREYPNGIYPREVLITLREKLLDDFMKLVAHKIPLEEVEKIIDKRFGK